jgi:hypothetical protein
MPLGVLLKQNTIWRTQKNLLRCPDTYMTFVGKIQDHGKTSKSTSTLVSLWQRSSLSDPLWS